MNTFLAHGKNWGYVKASTKTTPHARFENFY